MTEIETNEISCSLCGTLEKTHACGEGYLCHRCCTNIMSIPDQFSWIFDWLENAVVPHSHKMKKLLI
jgi:hypothetical protein